MGCKSKKKKNYHRFFRPEDVHIEPNEDFTPYQNIFSDSKYDGTLVKKYLTEDLLKKLMEIQEPSIIDCIAKVNTLDTNPFGVNVFNANCYSAFCDLFEPIIKEIHCVDEYSAYPNVDWGDVNMFEKLESETIISMEISCCRSLSKIPFISGINEQGLENVLTTVSKGFWPIFSNNKMIPSRILSKQIFKIQGPKCHSINSNG